MSKSNGQVSIFLIFIFHILFLFFAMVINVGMLVHHKINLQNSTDLAAYYGAMKQSEILGAIAHSNYQIRQSWKLMNFRYHILGGIGTDKHPSALNKNGTYLNPAPDAMSDHDSVFCMAHDPLYITRDKDLIDNTPGAQSFCKNSTPAVSLAGMTVPKFVGFIALHQTITKGAELAKKTADKDFIDGGFRNFKLLTLFVTLYRSDVKNRKLIINELAHQLSHSENDFNDLDGASTYLGLKKTFYNNLTIDNADLRTSNIKLFNSMGHRNCGRRDDVNFPPDWLKQITAMSQYIYFDTEINPDDDDKHFGLSFKPLTMLPKMASNPTFNLTPDDIKTLEFMQELSDPGQVPNQNFYDVVGVEKNPWCLTYVGVTAQTTPNLPFMPSSIKINLTASAYAKAFGGKIGPWYESQWLRSSPISKGGTKIDLTLPLRREDPATQSAISTDNTHYQDRRPNYARYPGDQAGILSLQVKRAYGDIIMKLAKDRTLKYNTAAWTNKAKALLTSQSNLNNGLPIMPSNLDILAEDVSNENILFKGGKELRDLELIGIAPDLFDITYYSIEPNFGSLYLNKLKSLFPDLYARGDFGSAVGKPYFNVIEQMNLVGANNFQMNFTNNGLYHTVFKTNPTDENDPIWGRVLTNWTEKSLLDYSIDQVTQAGMFGHCKEPLPQNIQKDNPTQGECLRGGRTGYSVKLVSKKYLNREDLFL